MAFWIFKCDPSIYDLDNRVADAEQTITWSISKYRTQVAVGDVAFLWQTGKDRGIRAATRIDVAARELPELGAELGHYHDAGGHAAQRIIENKYRVIGTLICRGANHSMDELRRVPGLE